MSEASSSPRSVSSSAPTSASAPRSGGQHGHKTFTNISAMDLLQTLPLTAAGRPALFGNEVEIYSEEHIGLYDRALKTPHLHGRCSVTTHRLFYMDETSSPPVAFFVPLEWIFRITKEAGFLQRSAKVRVDITTRAPPLATSFLKLSFKDGGRDDFFNPLEASLKRKAWKDTQPSHLTDRRLVKRQFNAADAGIAGIMRRQQEAQKETTELAATAFSDLANMMLKARDMVSLIERYVDTQKAVELSEEDGATTSREEDINKLSSLMLDMGITSPVTRENSGAAYYEQLARQLAEYLSDHMPKNGGIMTLSDIYCMFNRARGVELVSPDDLYHAALLQKKLKLGYSVRKFPGGLIVLQTDSHREDKVAERLATMAQKSSSGYITSTDVSVEMHTSFPLAWEYLKVAEELGKLCRDETFEGTNFYPNKFEQFVQDTEVE
ncbi:Vacuolar protein-sorting-associated protein 36 [Phytophthora pseudosyringae]|uniref:Vacuolar protein-sorting-associated protein 36 n=1 Tax=Phytophthora pseudosyringae TaxID=221518 RepID=A0A8T1VKF8_9STRA|nr:Vacuolar protein-sorting-associated protein 36 [Phytophthora pseudosyringae]